MCGDCGTVHLLAGEAAGKLVHLRSAEALDEFELEIEGDAGADESESDEIDDDLAGGRQHRVLIVNRATSLTGSLNIERSSRQIVDRSNETLNLRAYEDDGNGLACPVCETRETPRYRLFQHSRLGAPFLIGNILPTLLEYAPDGDKTADHPCRGRRLLTFNDSRQGTARMAARLQQDAERNRIRGLVYHLTLQHGQATATGKATDLAKEIESLETVHTQSPNELLAQMIEDKKSELLALSRPTPIAFNDLAQRLSNYGRDFDYMLKHYRQHAPGTFGEAGGPIELARMFLVREFGRRPKRLNNLESMGLVAVQYPKLSDIEFVPTAVTQVSDFDLGTWKDCLKILLDFFVRANGALAFSRDWRNWLGMPFPQIQLVNEEDLEVGRNQRRWPRAGRVGTRSLMVRLLSYSLEVDVDTALGEDRVDGLLQAAWDSLIGLGILQQAGDGRVLPLDQLAFSPMAQAWICPITRRLLDTTLKGVTPYLPEMATAATAMCDPVEIPVYDRPFGDITDEIERIDRGREWVASQEGVTSLREQGVWSNLNDRTIELAPYFTTAEHSAQQDSSTLERYERAFKNGDINLLSCSTTMEMGIDIGGISLVAMNNVPPHPANYLQRTGRAGRRREARSLAMTVCKANPHDQAVFGNSRWAFDTSLPAPRVSLDSTVIVQRHIHSLLLSRFLAEMLLGTDQEQTKLTCGFFFLGEDAMSSRFAAWCRGFSENESPVIASGLRQISRNSSYDGQSLNRAMDQAAVRMDEVASRWQVEWERLEEEENEIKQAGGETSPAFKAVTIHKERMSGEYLLRELATKGFLPAYGFPTSIAPFDNLTVGRYIREQRKRESERREDNRYKRRELASRDLTTALREYAPGSEVVLDGLVYRSAGVTLNWHIPVDQTAAREIQDIRLAWRCQQCGASGSSYSMQAASRCDSCGASLSPENCREFLEPAGFAVDFYKDPGNDVTTQHFVPVEAPWIDADGDWFPLANPELGRFRSTTRGHVLHQSRGTNGTGYALCLECGRAEPMTVDGSRPAVFTEPHRKLRRSREDGLFCPGSDDSWKIKEGITLGHETWTDIFELQLRTANGGWLNNSTTATTLAVALRDALSELIGVQANELGCDVKPAQGEDGLPCQSIVIFDRYAAGYASAAERYFDKLFQLARRRLDCNAGCDSACPSCVLDYDQRFAVDRLDRHRAKEVLTDQWLNKLHLPEELAFWGEASQPEYLTLFEALWHSVRSGGAGSVRLVVGGAFKDWDVGPAPLRELIYRLAGQNVTVELLIADLVVEELSDIDRFLLASLADHPLVSVRALDSIPKVGSGILIAEATTTSKQWALADDACIEFAPGWGSSHSPLVTTRDGQLFDKLGRTLAPDEIRPKGFIDGDRELEIQGELDGPLQGFGERFWTLISGEHAATGQLVLSGDDGVSSISYQDRYLFTPLSVATLAEVVDGLRSVVGADRWAVQSVEVLTTEKRVTGDNRTKNRVWSDWEDNSVRDGSVEAVFDYLGLEAKVTAGPAAGVEHSRKLNITFASGASLTVRLDQGLSYWRASRSNSRQVTFFDTQNTDTSANGERLARMAVEVEGGQLPTQLFVKVR